MDRDFDKELERAFQAYKASVAVPEPGVAFNTSVWAVIEARRSARLFGFWAKALTSSALAASLLLGVMTSKPAPHPEPEYLSAIIASNSPSPMDAELATAILEADSSR